MGVCITQNDTCQHRKLPMDRSGRWITKGMMIDRIHEVVLSDTQL